MNLYSNRFQFFDPKRYIFLLLIFLFVFPKGGFKIGGVPITWGYVLLALLSIAAIFGKHLQVRKDRLHTLLFLFPFQLLSGITMIWGGVGNVGMAISFWTSFFFLPYSFLLVFSQEIDELDPTWFFSILKKGMLFISIYGILLFAYRWITGEYIEIPFLTTNFDDLGLLDEKCNRRALTFSKLVSTYNNGNLFGACLILILPLYCYVETKIYKQGIVKLALLLTLSRTVWIGLFAHEMLYSLFLSKNKSKALLKIGISFLTLIGILAITSFFLGFSVSFFLDAKLGGRDVQLQNLSQVSFFHSDPFYHILEMVYIGVARSFGWVGLITFLIGVCGPFIFHRLTHPRLSPIHQAIFVGLLNYWIIAGSDGGMLYLPTMAFYWFMGSLFFRESFEESAKLAPQ